MRRSVGWTLLFTLSACAHRESPKAVQPIVVATADPIAHVELSSADLRSVGKHFGCSTVEGVLTEIAEGFARERLVSGTPVRIGQVVTDLRKRNLHYVWPKVAFVSGMSWGHVQERMVSNEGPKGGAWTSAHGQAQPSDPDRPGPNRHCGISVVSRSDAQETALSVLSADVFAEVEEISERPRTGVFQTIRWALRAPTPSLELYVLGPDGSSRRTLVSVTGEKAHAPFAAPRPGRYMLQLVGDLGSGPRPLSESWIFADVSPSYPSDPPIALRTSDPREAISEAVMVLRTTYGQKELIRDPSLDAEAAKHTLAMSRTGRIAHNVGEGDARERFTRSGIERRSIGEVVAMGTSLDDAWGSLLSSASHRATLVDPAFTFAGASTLEDTSHRTWITINLASAD
ncbi:MAG: CAP domain-containing protein [Polyangiaceae bacterium]|nr:CAP domain-containing protein [Polyangiaceae bacterium]